MKVLFHIPFPAVGGAETQIKYLIKHLSPNIRATVTYEHQEVEAFVKSLHVPYTRVFSYINLAKTIGQLRPDIVHFYHSHTMNNALRRLTIPRPRTYEIVHNRAGFPGDSTSYSKEYTDAVVCVSPDAYNYFKEKMPTVDAVVIPNGVDTSVYRPSLLKPKRITPVGGFTGRLEAGPGKGVPKLIEIISKLPVEFELVGQDYGGYAAMIKKEGIKNIRVLPHDPNPIKYYHNWDFFVSASPAEGFGLSIAEAMMSGLRSAIWNCGGVCHYIEHGVHALLSSNDGEFADHIMKVAFGKVTLYPETLDLSAAKMTSAYEDLYQELLGHVKIHTAPQNHSVVKPSTSGLDKVLAVTVDSWHGVRRAMLPISDYFSSPEGAIAAIRNYRPKIVIFGCYQMGWEKILAEARKMGCRTVLTWHASYILNEFDHVNREWMFHALKAAKSGMFDFVATPHKGLARTWTHYGVPTEFLPNIVDKVPDIRKPKDGFNVGIFGSGMPWKNMDCQIIAADMAGAQAHIQNLKHPQAIDVLGVKVTKHPHVKSDDDYFDLLGSMTVNMCVTLSEVYSYLTIESLMLGVPVLTGDITPILFDAPSELSVLRTSYFEDPYELAAGLKLIKELREELSKVGRSYAVKLNEQNKVIAAAVKAKWLE